MKYYVNMSAADEAKLLDECRALEEAYADAYAEHYDAHIAAWYDTSEGMACVDAAIEDWEDIHLTPQQMGWVDSKGRP